MSAAIEAARGTPDQASGGLMHRTETIDGALRWELLDLYADYAACLDGGRYDDWPAFFVDECHYRVMPRENYDRGLPLSTIDLQSNAMLRDRVYGVVSTLYHAPYYQRHVIGPLRILEVHGDTVRVEANYVVLRTKRDTMTEVYNAGRYLDVIKLTPEGPRFVEKLCVFDSELISNSLIYPI